MQMEAFNQVTKIEAANIAVSTSQGREGVHISSAIRNSVLPQLLIDGEMIDLTKDEDDELANALAIDGKLHSAGHQPMMMNGNYVARKHPYQPPPASAYVVYGSKVEKPRKMVNFELARKLPVTLHIGGRLQQFPKKPLSDATTLNHVLQPAPPPPPPPPPVPTVAHMPITYPNRTSHGFEHAPMPGTGSFHRHFMENPSETGVLGAIFVNNLLQQSIAEYQKMRSKAYPHLLPAPYRINGTSANSAPRVIRASPPVPTTHRHEFCSTHRDKRPVHIAPHTGSTAITKSVSSTFTAPSASSVVMTSRTNTSAPADRSTEDVLHHISSTYHTIEMQQSANSQVSPQASRVQRRRRQTSAKVTEKSPSITSRTKTSSHPKNTSQQPIEKEAPTSETGEAFSRQPDASPAAKNTADTSITQRKKTAESPERTTADTDERKTTCTEKGTTADTDKEKNADDDKGKTAGADKTKTADTDEEKIAVDNADQDTTSLSKEMQTNCFIHGSEATNASVNNTNPFTIATAQPTRRRASKRTVAFTAGNEQTPQMKAYKYQYHWRGGNHGRKQRNTDPKRNIRSVLRSASKQPAREVSPKIQITAVEGAVGQKATNEMYIATNREIAETMAPPTATVTLEHSCRFYRCQSMTQPSAVLGQFRICRQCYSNYSIACGNISSGACTINLADVECPKCWNSNACYCGQPFSDRYIGGREMN